MVFHVYINTKFNLKRFFIVILFSFYSSIVIAQKIYITTNKNINVRITVNDSTSYETLILKNKFKQVNISQYLKINSVDNFHSVKYFFNKSSLLENDTLNISIVDFHRIDTTFINSGCLENDKYKSTSNISIKTKEFNKNEIEIDKLPLSIKLQTQSRFISLFLNQEYSTFMTHWNGENKKTKQRCGGNNSEPKVELTYTTQQ